MCSPACACTSSIRYSHWIECVLLLQNTFSYYRMCSLQDMLFFSMHLFHPLQPLAPGSGEQYEFYPGTGGADRTLENIINVPISPCWYAGKYYYRWKILLTVYWEEHEFYPGTGGADRTLDNIFYVPVGPCWYAGKYYWPWTIFMNVPISPCWYAGKYYQPWKMLLTCLLVLVLAFFFLKVSWFCGPARYSNSNVIQISHPTHGFSFPFFFLAPFFSHTHF